MHIARLRAAVGHDLLVPSVTVLPLDEAGRVLLVHHGGHHDGWGVVGGAIEIGESPAQAAGREAGEEIGAKVRLVRLLDVLGGPDYQVTYPNGDHTAYVTAVYAAELAGGVLRPDGSEVSALAWFTREELAGLALSRFARGCCWQPGTCDARHQRPARGRLPPPEKGHRLAAMRAS